MKTPRPYQVDCIDAVRESLKVNQSALIVLPTGMGKTVIATKLMTGWLRGNSLFLAHTTELIEQAAERLEAEMDGYKPVVEMNIRGADAYTIHQGDMIVVASVQSMMTDRRLEKYAKHPFGLIIIDEAHRATSAMYRKVIDFYRERNPDLRVVGMTATPCRSDGAALGMVFETTAYQTTINVAIEDGWLCPIAQRSITIHGLDFSGLRSRLNEFGERDYSAADVEKIVEEEENLQAYAKAILDEAGDRSTLVFTPGVQSAHMLASILCRYRDRCAEAADGETPKQLRADIVDRFRNGRTQFLCNALLYTEGFDAPNCSCVAMCRPTKSVGRYIQMLGRGLRPLPGIVDGIADAFDRKTSIFTSAKPNCLVLDFVGVSEHKLVDVWDALAGNYDLETVELAEREGDKKNVLDDLDKAKLLRQLMLQWQERKPIVADDVQYSTYDVNPFGGPAPVTNKQHKPKGSATPGQVDLLVKLGVTRETAETYSKRQAHAVIDQISSKRCTTNQGNTLRKNGINPDGVNMDQASALLDALARNGWRRLSSEQVIDILGG